MGRPRTNPPVPKLRCWLITLFIYTLSVLSDTSHWSWPVKLACFSVAFAGGNILIEWVWVHAVEADDKVWRKSIDKWASEQQVIPGQEQAPWN